MTEFESEQTEPSDESNEGTNPMVTKMKVEEARRKFPQCGEYPLITSSDAHTPDGIGKSSTTFLMEGVSVKEMKRALMGEDGRKVLL